MPSTIDGSRSANGPAIRVLTLNFHLPEHIYSTPFFCVHLYYHKTHIALSHHIFGSIEPYMDKDSDEFKASNLGSLQYIFAVAGN